MLKRKNWRHTRATECRQAYREPLLEIIEWKIHLWNDLRKSYKIMSNELRENWIPRVSERSMNKEKEK